MRKVRIGLIGLGARAETLSASFFALRDEVEVVAICDVNPARIEKLTKIYAEHNAGRPVPYDDYRKLIADPNVEAVLVPTSWNSHLRIAHEAMRAGKYVGIEVGGASSTDELWELVHSAEATGVSCMMLENCCYGRNELMALNLARKGLFGELIYCTCGYEHDLSEMGVLNERRQERSWHNYRRCGDLYPTHGLGPIAKILRINRGNRFVSLTSQATKARGFQRKNADGLVFNEGDIVNTCIKCANGEMVMLTHGVSLPRPYSRDCRVQGTKGLWLEEREGVYIEGISPTYDKIDIAGNPYTVHEWTTVTEMYEKYDHPIWKEASKNPIGEHGGMDSLALRAFLDSVRNHTPTPIDVYDVAAWMSVTCLSEQSIAMGGMPVPFPDYTNGKWIDEIPAVKGYWSLDEVYEDATR